jgi:multicomponent Na+:H+ antiporter subunit F
MYTVTVDMFAYVGMGILLVCGYLCLYRIGHGPTAPDRTVAIDILGVILVGFCSFLCIMTGRDFYINMAIAWALLSFIGTLALAKYLEGKGLDE